MELSQEVYRYDATRDWAFSKQTLEVVDNRAQVQVALRQPIGRPSGDKLPALQRLRDPAQRLRGPERQALRGEAAGRAPAAPPARGPLRLRRHLRQGLGRAGHHRPGDPGVLRLARRPHVLRQLPRRAPGRLPASGQGEPGRGLHVLPGARVLLQVGRGGLPLRRHPAQRGPLPRRSGRKPRCRPSPSGGSGPAASSRATSGPRTCAASAPRCWPRATSPTSPCAPCATGAASGTPPTASSRSTPRTPTSSRPGCRSWAWSTGASAWRAPPPRPS